MLNTRFSSSSPISVSTVLGAVAWVAGAVLNVIQESLIAISGISRFAFAVILTALPTASSVAGRIFVYMGIEAISMGRLVIPGYTSSFTVIGLIRIIRASTTISAPSTSVITLL